MKSVLPHSLKIDIPQDAIESPGTEAAVLKLAIRTARTRIIASELFLELFVSVHHAHPSLDPRFGWVTLSTLARPLESGTSHRNHYLYSS
jgi:hypothetical protein